MTGLRIAIDGPSGAGKSTLARALATRLELPYVDTGAMYRAIALASVRAAASAPAEVVELLAEIDLRIDPDPAAFRVLLEGRDISADLRATEVSMRASEIAQIPEVREWLVERQRQAAAGGAVVEGRDIGEKVLPDADLKLFVTASEEVRMGRRAAQIGDGDDARLEQEIRERDRRDRERKASPLRVPHDAVVIDTSEESPEASLARILDRVRELRADR
jgi:cytidylate kinase